MGIIDTINSFKKDTGVDLFKAIEEEGILLGMGLIMSELDLTEAMMKDLTYKDKIEQLKQVYFKRNVKKKFSLTDKEVENAIKQSLQNSVLGVTAFRKDCRYSEWLLNDGEAKNICQKYADVLNPLYFMLEPKDQTLLVRSIFVDDNLGLPSYGVKNGYSVNGLQRYRATIPLAKKGRYYVMGSEKVLKNLYHPIVWYLLSIHGLDGYLTPEFRVEINKLLIELKKKQDATLNK